ncbi:Crp/Fnr family transcriptional regulator [Rhizobium rhizogenes]|uniref:Crp/Fnr family transcriptional regulator n=1 Tax=Rhizobium rhizogenes TaxID=359 RepID=UPI0028691292|nr:Crp/Fnr family transcriptional regulator [Rhizobium rhizogenes]
MLLPLRGESMSPPKKSDIRNTLLRCLSDQDFDHIARHLESIDLPKRFMITTPDRISDYIYFLETGIGSVVVRAPDGKSAEIGIFGREGFSPTVALQGADSAPFSIFMQVAGAGYRIQNAHIMAAASDRLEMRNLFLRYVQAASIQTAYTAFSNAADQIEQRLARWLLMCHDRTDGDKIDLTHDFLAVMLAVRRQSVTTTLHVLEGKHLVLSQRGFVTIRDRVGLEALAGSSYGVPEREYRRLISQTV